MLLMDFDRLIWDWQMKRFRDMSTTTVLEMNREKDAIKAQYNTDTFGGPWNYAEGNLREGYRAFQERWETFLDNAKTTREEQQVEPHWLDNSMYSNPGALPNQGGGGSLGPRYGFANYNAGGAFYGTAAGPSSSSTQNQPATSSSSSSREKGKKKKS